MYGRVLGPKQLISEFYFFSQVALILFRKDVHPADQTLDVKVTQKKYERVRSVRDKDFTCLATSVNVNNKHLSGR